MLKTLSPIYIIKDNWENGLILDTHSTEYTRQAFYKFRYVWFRISLDNDDNEQV